MSAPDMRTTDNWWAEGDTPVHYDSRVTYLIDGRAVMLEMCRHFLKARKYIYLANWGITPQMELVRGTDHRAGPDGSPEQQALLAELRAEGLQEADIDFWYTHDLSLQAVLGYAVSKGVDVKVLLWDCLPIFSHYKPKEAYKQLTAMGITCILDDSARGLLHHPAESLHQKTSLVDGIYAFVGGIDPLIEAHGDFDRWDMHLHLFSSPLRQTHENTSPHPWHDIQALIEGPAAGDVELNFRQRWNDVVQRHRWDAALLIPEHPLAPPEQTTTITQIARTIPQRTYSFDPDPGLQDIAQLYIHAFHKAQHFVYLENQYFWLHAYSGIAIPQLGKDCAEMEHIIHELGAALQRGVTVAFILPDHPNVGRAFTDRGLTYLREEAPEAVEQGRLQVFCLGTSTSQEGKEHYRPIYVHAKVAIIDDHWTTVGSANLNNRGMRDDTEINVATLDAQLARHLRLQLWGEHLGLLSDEESNMLARHLGHKHLTLWQNVRAKHLLHSLEKRLGDPIAGLHLLHEHAQDNLRRYKAREPLAGHLLPYLMAQEAIQQGLPFREEHGWIEEP